MGNISTAKLFSALAEIGQKELSKILADVSAPEKQRSFRHWNITEASELIGRSKPWIRENDPDCPTDDRGRRYYSLERIYAVREQAGTAFFRPRGTQPAVVAVFNFKGGVGKTTTVIHLAHKAAIDGLRVLVVDLDSQASATTNLANVIPDLELGEDDLISKVFLEDIDGIKSIIRKTYFYNVDIVPANRLIQDLDLILPNPDLNNHETMGGAATRLQRALSKVSDDYDLILIDCPPNMGALSSSAVVSSNGLIAPLPPRGLDRASFVMLTSSLSRFYKVSKGSLDMFKVLITDHPGTPTANKMERRIRAMYSPYVLEGSVFTSTEIEKSSALLSSLYHQEGPINSRETYKRSLDNLNAVNEEILEEIKANWRKPHA